jgi:hypothetical protein
VGVVGKLRAVPAVEKPSPPALLVCDEPKREEVREAGVDAVGVVAAKLGKVVVEVAGVDGVAAAGVKDEPMLKLNGVDAAPPVVVAPVRRREENKAVSFEVTSEPQQVRDVPAEGHRPPPADGVAAPGVAAPAAGVAEAAGVANGITDGLTRQTLRQEAKRESGQGRGSAHTSGLLALSSLLLFVEEILDGLVAAGGLVAQGDKVLLRRLVGLVQVGHARCSGHERLVLVAQDVLQHCSACVSTIEP